MDESPNASVESPRIQPVPVFLLTVLGIAIFLFTYVVFSASNVDVLRSYSTGSLLTVSAFGLVISFCVSCVLMLLAAVDIWILLGDSGTSRRLFWAYCVNLGVGLAVGPGALLATLRFDEHRFTQTWVMFATQRFIACSVFAVLGLGIRRGSKWRLTGPIADSEPRQPLQATISDWMFGMAIIATFLVMIDYWIRLMSAESLMTVIGCLAVELLFVLVYILPPAANAFTSRWTLRPALVLALWICLVGFPLSLLIFVLPFVRAWGNDAAIYGGLICLGVHAVAAVSAWTVFWQLHRIGFRFSLVGGRVTSFGWPSRMASVVSVSLAWIVVGLVSWFDVPILLESGSLSRAKGVAWMSRFHGRFPKGRSWGADKVPGVADWHLAGSSTTLTAKLNGIASPGDAYEEVHLTIRGEDTFSPEVINLLTPLSLHTLALHRGAPDEESFARLCLQSGIAELAMQADFTTVRHLESMHDLVNLKRVRLIGIVEPTQAVIDVISGLPIDDLAIRPGADVDLSKLRGVRNLGVYDAQIGAEQVQQLKALWLKRLVLHDCTIDDAAMQLLAGMKLQSLILSSDRENDSVAEDALLQLATATDIRDLKLRLRLGTLASNRLANRFGKAVVVDWSEDKRIQQLLDDGHEGLSLFEFLSRKHNGNVEEILAEMATELRRSDAGDIVELDLQGIPLRDMKLHSIPQLERLRRLRIGHWNQTHSTFEMISRMRSLRELEISYGRLDDAAFENICKLKDLVRLQLPISELVHAGRCRRPERIPLSLGYIDTGSLSESHI